MTRNELKKELQKYGYMYAKGSDTSESHYLDGDGLFVYDSKDEINDFNVIEAIFISEEMVNSFCLEGWPVPEEVVLACYRYAATPLDKRKQNYTWFNL